MAEKASSSPDVSELPGSEHSLKNSLDQNGRIEPQCPPHTTERKLMTKVDFRLIPILVLVYILAFLDRVNISNALTLGMPAELHLNNVTDQQSNIALAIFFVPYVLLEVPSNWLMKYVKPHIWLSGCITFFGVFMLAQGFVKNYSGLLATRFFLGLAEAGIFPGCFYLISFYYKRNESQQRFTWFFCSATIASAVGSLIASGIATMNGAQGLSSWRWIFIIEGALTIFFGILSFFLIVDFPASAKWLREDEREFILARSNLDRDIDREPITAKGVARFFADPKKVIGAFIYFGTLIPLYSFTYFAPTIIQTLHLSTVQTQLHTVPPFAAALVLSLVLSYASDKVQLRYPFLLFTGLMVVAGVAMLQAIHTGFSARYASLFLVIMGTFSAGPIIICWSAMNMRGHLDRAIGTAWLIGFGNIGGLIATFLFPTRDAVNFYHIGYSVCQAGACLGVLTSTLYFIMCVVENRKRRQRGEQDLMLL